MKAAVFLLIALACWPVGAAEQVEIRQQHARPGTWEPIRYPTPLRNFFFGSARFRPDPGYRWQPGQWVPVQPPPPMQWVPGQWVPVQPQESPR